MIEQLKPQSGIDGLPRKRCPRRETEECLAQLRHCYSGGDDAFSWPSRELLSRLHKYVNELARTRRKRPFDDPWKAYLAVDCDFPKLRLVPVLGNLVRAFLEKLRAEIQVNPEQILFYRIRRITERNGDNAQLAEDLLTHFRELNAGTINCKNVFWDRFVPLLRNPGKNYVEIAIGNAPASISVLCYARILEGLLEIQRVFRLADCRPLMFWLRQSAARELPRGAPDLIPNLLAYHFLEPVDGRALERRVRARRERKRAAVDSQRYRAKKKQATFN